MEMDFNFEMDFEMDMPDMPTMEMEEIEVVALELGMNYKEFPPAHYNWNMHCVRPAGEYQKPFYISNYHKRNKQIVDYSDIIVAFMPEGISTKGTMSTLRYAESEKKLIKILN